MPDTLEPPAPATPPLSEPPGHVFEQDHWAVQCRHHRHGAEWYDVSRRPSEADALAWLHRLRNSSNDYRIVHVRATCEVTYVA